MRFHDIEASILALFRETPRVPVYISGSPGLGKTALGYTVAEKLGIAPENVTIFRPSIHDPVDLNA